VAIDSRPAPRVTRPVLKVRDFVSFFPLSILFFLALKWDKFPNLSSIYFGKTVPFASPLPCCFVSLFSFSPSLPLSSPPRHGAFFSTQGFRRQFTRNYSSPPSPPFLAAIAQLPPSSWRIFFFSTYGKRRNFTFADPPFFTCGPSPLFLPMMFLRQPPPLLSRFLPPRFTRTFSPMFFPLFFFACYRTCFSCPCEQRVRT